MKNNKGSALGSLFDAIAVIMQIPILRWVFLGIAVIVLIVGLAFLLYWGLFTAFLLFVGSGAVVLILDWSGALPLKEYPILLAIPIGLAAVGYFGERLGVVDATVALDVSAPNPHAIILLQVFLSVIIVSSVIILIRRQQKK
jgi:hypothetical protein